MNCRERIPTQGVPFALCADDYGLTPGIGVAVRELLSMGRLSAASCLVVSPFWETESRLLRDLDSDADIGLHVALTDLKPIAPMPHLAPSGQLPSLVRLLLCAHSGQIHLDEVSQEIDRQIDAFSQAMGRPPDYIDGHHHVHQLPVVRDALLKQLILRLPSNTAVRISYEPLTAIWRRSIARLKATMISTGALSLRHAVYKAGIRCNQRFSGIRDFSESPPYGRLFRRFIMNESEHPIEGLALMCHPGHPHLPSTLDTIANAREGELAYLLADEFVADLEKARMRIGRFKDLPRDHVRL